VYHMACLLCQERYTLGNRYWGVKSRSNNVAGSDRCNDMRGQSGNMLMPCEAAEWPKRQPKRGGEHGRRPSRVRRALHWFFNMQASSAG
jgi:hypothetical protein